VKVIVPIRIESTPNLRESWQKRSKRAREHKHHTYWALKATRASYMLPCMVTLTRIAPRTLDSDNNVAGLKSARDGVALWLNADDADPRIEWAYRQRRGHPKQYALEIEVDTQ